MAGKISFATQLAPVAEKGVSDTGLYHEAIADARLAQRLGYSAGWVLEHHFSDYYPTPNPLMLLSYVAAACPGFGLGTAVMVLPWYNPVRFAEDIAALQVMSGADLHIGLGRGNAPLEYEAFDVAMSEARARFKESWDIVRTGLKGKPFSYKGEFLNVRRDITIRPLLEDKKPNFYGAITSTASAGIMADQGLPPLVFLNFPDELLYEILTAWKKRSKELGLSTEVTLPVLTLCYIADTNEEARQEAKKFLPEHFRLQYEHYEVHRNAWSTIPGYEETTKMFLNFKKMLNIENIEGLLDQNLIGTPEHITKRIETVAKMGFNHFIIRNGTPTVTREARHRMLTRFANEIAPHFGHQVPNNTVAA